MLLIPCVQLFRNFYRKSVFVWKWIQLRNINDISFQLGRNCEREIIAKSLLLCLLFSMLPSNFMAVNAEEPHVSNLQQTLSQVSSIAGHMLSYINHFTLLNKIPPNWVTLTSGKLWLLSSLFSHFWILLHLLPAIIIGKEKGTVFSHRRQAISILSKFRLLAPWEQGPVPHFYTKLNHLVHCYASCCHSVNICLYLHAKILFRVLYCVW